MNEVKTPKQTNTYYIAVSIIYTFKKTKLDAQYKAKDLKIMKAYKSKEKTNLWRSILFKNNSTTPKMLYVTTYSHCRNTLWVFF